MLFAYGPHTEREDNAVSRVSQCSMALLRAIRFDSIVAPISAFLIRLLAVDDYDIHRQGRV